MNRTICVFASSSDHVRRTFFEKSEELGRLIAASGDHVIFGAGEIGLMGAVGRAVKSGGGRVIGVIPEVLNRKGIVFENPDELVVTKTMGERKEIMETRADAFIALPGGFGTLEEILEVITLKQLGYHRKPIVFLNTSGFYSSLSDLFDELFRERFIDELFRDLYYIAAEPKEVIDYLNGYSPKSYRLKV
ncbi:MAG: Rossman fold protein, TIGR00730 family [Spirochaetes bacterium GWF1_51_8]|nr:MAG: Rossman fold protein, TIGR00730 family [Spirochaetes bacterium GWF1_51_8]